MIHQIADGYRCALHTMARRATPSPISSEDPTLLGGEWENIYEPNADERGMGRGHRYDELSRFSASNLICFSDTSNTGFNSLLLRILVHQLHFVNQHSSKKRETATASRPITPNQGQEASSPFRCGRLNCGGREKNINIPARVGERCQKHVCVERDSVRCLSWYLRSSHSNCSHVNVSPF